MFRKPRLLSGRGGAESRAFWSLAESFEPARFYRGPYNTAVSDQVALEARRRKRDSPNTSQAQVETRQLDPTSLPSLPTSRFRHTLSMSLALVPNSAGAQQRAFNPYSVRPVASHRPDGSAADPGPRAQENGGTILAISSQTFAIVAGDTRQSEGYSIQTRYARKCHQLTDEVVMAVQGFQADGSALVKRVKQRLEVS